MAALAVLRADLARSGKVTGGEAALLRRQLAARDDELARMRRGSHTVGALGNGLCCILSIS